MAVKPVSRDLAIGEEPDQREFAEGLADEAGLDPRLAEQRHAARDAADLHAGFRWPRKTTLQLLQHAEEVGARAVGIAAAEQDLVARRDLVADNDPALARVNGHQVAHQI